MSRSSSPLAHANRPGSRGCSPFGRIRDGTPKSPSRSVSRGGSPSRAQSPLSRPNSRQGEVPIGTVLHADLTVKEMPPRREPPDGSMHRKEIPPVNTQPSLYYAWLHMPDKPNDIKSLRFMPDSVNGSPRNWMRHWEYPAIKRPPSPRALRRLLQPLQHKQDRVRAPQAASPNSTWVLETSMSVDSSGRRSPRQVEVGWGQFSPSKSRGEVGEPWLEVLPFGCVGEKDPLSQSSVCSLDKAGVSLITSASTQDGLRSDSRLVPSSVRSRGQSLGQSLVLGGETSRAVLHKAMHGRKSPKQWQHMQRHAGTGRINKDRAIYDEACPSPWRAVGSTSTLPRLV
mmetsp:Transcript_38520/g.86617  ORF Transcript_38520/g.86617 Transcript_38520/m.86617 type:complete len:341 (-) Transcript_38520:12-1034(-)